MTKRLRHLLEAALGAASPSLRVVATRAGLSYHQVRRYRHGDRTPAPDVFARLARALRAQAAQLTKYADAFDQASRGDQ